MALLGLAAITGVVAALLASRSDDRVPRAQRPFSADGVWNRPVPRTAPVDYQSPALVSNLVGQVQARGAWINTRRFSVPVYTVGADVRRVRVAVDVPSSMSTDARDADALKRALAEVPIPAEARPADGGDRHMVIWQPSTDTMWELWLAHHVPEDPCAWAHVDELGWHAAWGARIDNVSENHGAPAHPFGATASGLAAAGGLMRVEELRRRRIDHALALALPLTARDRATPPATRTDGQDVRPGAIPEGTRFRLDPNLDVDALRLSPVAAAMAKAAQRYGIVVRDRADAVVFYAEDPRPLGSDPYPSLFGNRSPAELLAGFPWTRLEVVAP